MSTIKVNRILTSSGGEGVDADIVGNVTGNVTAPDSITVGTAVTISAGVITATSFSGDGSGLSGIDATSLKDSEGNIVAQAVGSGLLITGVTTVSNKLMVGDSYISAGNVGLGTTTTAGRDAGISTAVGSIIYNATEGLVQVYKENKGWVAIDNPNDTLIGHTATGGVINDYTVGSDIYRSHTFGSSGEFIVSSLGTLGNPVECLVVAGGGGGGSSAGGGGGAGGMRTGELPVSVATYAITVGAGGGGSVDNPAGSARGTNGGDSTFSTITSTGGGGGGSRTPSGTFSPTYGPGNVGGSGGGASMDNPGGGGAANPAGQGNDGGAGPAMSGGGGGAGQAGIPGPTSGVGGQSGGNGLPNVYAYGPTGPITYAGGGGGGGAYQANSNPGGTGGGGEGGGDNYDVAGNGTPGLGGGGGGGSNGTSQPPGHGVGGSGGGGVVVIRYKIGTTQTGTAKATGGSVSFYNGKTIHTFLYSGTFVNASPITGVEITMVGGGGAGGTNIGGGGGAGAFMEGTGITLPANTYTMSVGAGGAGAGGNETPLGTTPWIEATSSTISWPGPNTWTALRGGYGGGYSTNQNAHPGGSGGGATPPSGAVGTAAGSNSPTPLGTLTYYGNAGGPAPGNFQGGGGGGAGGAGNAPPTPGTGGAGGIGRQIPSTFRDPRSAPGPTAGVIPQLLPQTGGGLGTPGPDPGAFYVAGGGGGADHNYPQTLPGSGDYGALGGAGGGGIGGYELSPGSVSPQFPANTNGRPGVFGTGAGGGGGGYYGTGTGGVQNRSGNGGPGIILIAYPT